MTNPSNEPHAAKHTLSKASISGISIPQRQHLTDHDTPGPLNPSLVKTVFLDRDGTLIQEKHYLHDPDDVVYEPGVFEGLSALQAAGYTFVIVTNQSGIGRGYFTEADFWRVQDKINADLAEHGIQLLATYFSPYHPTDGQGDYRVDSPCRKPNPGMLLQAIGEHGIDPSASFMIGDKAVDVLAGMRAGVRPVLVQTGYGADDVRNPMLKEFVQGRDFTTAPDFLGAVRVILGNFGTN